ncbi:MAG TPA: substrate-binding domain-containing protein [Solirubrobacteraceae bacterium]|jgi:simple sugar transport system substrate-binding protein|nr:substrate-binding domain-containing protein [Solirubrobacteraceae bacterium]
MSEHDDTLGDAIERLEWNDEKSGDVSKFAQISRRTALTGGAAGLAAALLEACGSSNNSGTGTAKASSGSSPVASIFGVKGGYKFTFVNHVTTNTFFTPTIAGIKDACKLLNCSYQWTGSTSSNVGQMASAIDTAVSAGVDGIATSLIATSLAKPVDAATKAGIPVVSYNADEPNTTRLAYIGQDLLLSGQQMGEKIKSLIPGGGKVMVFIATPGSANLAPRLTGIQQVLKGSNIQVSSQASGAAEPQEVTTIEAFVGKNLTSYKGYFAVDAGSTAAVALALKKYNLKGKVVGGGFDLTPDTEALLYNGTIQFAIDQQPYLQGFFPTLELFLYKATQGLTGAADIDTGLKFLDKTTIKPYATTKSRYEGTGTAIGVQKAS